MPLFDRATATMYKEMVDPLNSPIKPSNAVNPAGGGGGGKGMAPTPDDLNPNPKQPWKSGKPVPVVKRRISPDQVKRFMV